MTIVYGWMWCIWMIVKYRSSLLGGIRVVHPSGQFIVTTINSQPKNLRQHIHSWSRVIPKGEPNGQLHGWSGPNHHITSTIGPLIASISLGGCIVLNMYEYTWVHRRVINLNIVVVRIHTINTFTNWKIFMYTYIKHIFKTEYICIQRYLDI
jgi:hypothetical protein